MLYVLYSKGQNAVKIGWTRGCSKSRLSTLQTGNPEKLYLIYSEKGGVVRERELHKRFEKYRIRQNGEWFRLTGAVYEWLSSKKPNLFYSRQDELGDRDDDAS